MTLAVFAAAAIHGGVLFGWPRGDKPPPREETKWIPLDHFPPIPRDEEKIIVPPDDAAKPLKGVRVPTSDEPPVTVKIIDITIPKAPVVPIEVGRVKDIAIGPPGDPKGYDNVPRVSVIPSGLLDNSPRTLSQAQPIYPFDKKREGIAGEVHVEFTVDEAGRVIEPRVVHSTDRAFEAPTIAAVSKWRFEPGRRDGRIVRFKMLVPVLFSLNE
jgi:periplasmic protein TonB